MSVQYGIGAVRAEIVHKRLAIGVIKSEFIAGYDGMFRAVCGTGKDLDLLNSSARWKNVTCRRCLRRRVV
jgi:hypothetical protein